MAIYVLKNLLAASGLKTRTILSRIKLFYYRSYYILAPELDRKLHSIENAKKLFSILPKELEILDDDSILIHNKIIDLKSVFFSDLNKQDYLQLYTLHYLNFSFQNKKIPKKLINLILDSKISNEPFIESMQLFNIVMDKRLSTIIHNKEIIKKYNSLYKKIEYHVDGNHVIENLISLTIIELKFCLKNFQTLPKLVFEVKRQSLSNFHSENNLKYAKDLCLKIDIILNIIDFFQLNNSYSCELEKLISNWKIKLFEYSNNLILHDNIDGDDLKKSILKYILYSKFKKIKHIDIFKSIPLNGMRGHAFDAKISYPFFDLYKGFGTITYAYGNKRNYQRLRSNNCQVYLNRLDFSHIFHLSFRSVVLFPYKIKRMRSYDITELLISNKSLIRLKYKVSIFKNKIVITSKQNIKLDLFVDNMHVNDIRVQETLKSNNNILRNSLRATKINKLQRSKRITLSGNKINIFI